MKPKPMIGWREWVVLPALHPEPLKAKVDTGARTSALHAPRLRIVEANGRTVARFDIHPHQRSAKDAVRVEHEVIDIRMVRSSNGREEQRPVILTEMGLGDHRWPVELTLTARDQMGFRMLLGRAAVRNRFQIDPGRSFLLTGSKKEPSP